MFEDIDERLAKLRVVPVGIDVDEVQYFLILTALARRSRQSSPVGPAEKRAFGQSRQFASLCNAEHFAKLKKEGDQCKVHPDRAASQCFKCDPSKYEKFEQMYMAKNNGKKPERPPEEEFKK